MRQSRAIVAAIALVGAATELGRFEAQGLGLVRVPVPPSLLSQTGLYPPSLGSTSASFGGTSTADKGRKSFRGCGVLLGVLSSADCRLPVAERNRPFSPQYPLWSDGAIKRRWVYLPDGATIDTTNVDGWDFPIGTRFWKEFEFGGRRVETRFLWRATGDEWVFASYLWNDTQTDAILAPTTGVSNVAEVAPGRYHSIPAVADCRACHDSARTEILGFDALQLSNDRDPNAPHAEALTPEMITLRVLVEEGRLRPSRTEWAAAPPRIVADDERTRAALGYLSTNCGNCHNRQSSIASLGLVLEHSLKANPECAPALATSLGRAGHWVVPDAPEGESKLISGGHPELSAIVRRAKSRRPSSQMPPLGSVLADKEAVDLLTTWVRDDPAKWAERARRCGAVPSP